MRSTFNTSEALRDDDRNELLKSGFVNSALSNRDLRSFFRQQFQHARQLTLQIFGDLDRSTLCYQPHPDFSPIGWHLGHIAMTESMWLLETCDGQPDSRPNYRQLLLADGLPKQERCLLPPLTDLLAYLQEVRQRTFEYLEKAKLLEQQRLWYFILQHECQHAETAALVLALQKYPDIPSQPVSTSRVQSEMVEIPAGEFVMGCDRPFALDNEQGRHRRNLPTFWLDRYPVTQAHFGSFIEAGGYQHSDWWSPEGWSWLQSSSEFGTSIKGPRYWREGQEFGTHPVCGVSYYEAEAYARYVGKRLPTEAEWEKAASWDNGLRTKRLYPWGDSSDLTGSDRHCNLSHCHRGTTSVTASLAGTSAYGCQDMLGNVWEWTNSWFDGFPSFQYYPYRGYSQVYFDRQHRVLKGGSWATYPWSIRTSFRNWYHPWVRQIFAGFRCASDRPSE